MVTPAARSKLVATPPMPGRDVRAAVRRAADQQVGEVHEFQHRGDHQREIADRLVRQRNGRADDPGRARDYDLLQTIERDGELIIVVGNEVLVRCDDATVDLVALLRELGYEATPVDKLEGRVVLGHKHRRRSREDPAALATAIRRLESARRGGGPPPHIDVQYNFVAPMSIVMKADCSPEPAPQGHPFPGGRRTRSRVRVAVVDTGIAEQPRTDRWLANVPVTPANIDVLDDIPCRNGRLDVGAGHGTFAAGIIQQLAPDVPIRVYRALDSDGLGSEAAAATAMVQAAEDGATIINLSFGMETDRDQPPLALDVAVEVIRARFPDVVLVAAAGNYARNRKCWPAALKHVTAVAGLTRDLKPATWSSHGPWVDCATVGEGVWSPFVAGVEEDHADTDAQPDVYGQDAWAVWTGTSFAAPQVAGAVAQIARRDGIDPRDALARLLDRRKEEPNFGRVVRILRPA